MGGAPGAGVLDSYAALGVATARNFASALVKGPGEAAKTLRPGDTLEGWRLVGLDKEKLTFERGGARHVMTVGAPPASAGGDTAGAPPASADSNKDGTEP